MVRYLTFKNGHFKDSISEKLEKNMIHCSCCFLCNPNWFIYCWNHTISVDYIEKSLHFPICTMVKYIQIKITGNMDYFLFWKICALKNPQMVLFDHWWYVESIS